MSYCLQSQEFQEWQSVVLKLVILKYFENIELSPTINIYHGHIHKICEMEFRRINYRKSTVKMTTIRSFFY